MTTYPAYPAPIRPSTAPAAHPRTSGLAIASMVLGIVWLWWIGSLLAIIFGHVSLREIERSRGWVTGRGMAIAGLVLGYVGAATFGLVVVFAAIGGRA